MGGCDQPRWNKRSRCRQHLELGRLQARQRRVERNLSGQCNFGKCTLPRLPKRQFCEEHLGVLRETNRNRKSKLLEKGLCANCGSRFRRPDRQTCNECGAKAAAATAGHRASFEDRETFFTLQHGLCGICGGAFKNPFDGMIDHDHRTGDLRGLLCQNCNRGLGMFRDSIELLIRAAEYLSANHSKEKEANG